MSCIVPEPRWPMIPLRIKHPKLTQKSKHDIFNIKNISVEEQLGRPHEKLADSTFDFSDNESDCSSEDTVNLSEDMDFQRNSTRSTHDLISGTADTNKGKKMSEKEKEKHEWLQAKEEVSKFLGLVNPDSGFMIRMNNEAQVKDAMPILDNKKICLFTKIPLPNTRQNAVFLNMLREPHKMYSDGENCNNHKLNCMDTERGLRSNKIMTKPKAQIVNGINEDSIKKPSRPLLHSNQGNFLKTLISKASYDNVH
ncbi:uncharacterized protein LOC120533626 [Polypterus senegalus]|uniref:uncharacterized protein LOC120533626 n=1 Tax=Polypterus senegalus TaxID=55291 RepID=UPI001966AEA5|nr:uncharacterized protein LOC120533626 [Polypterus senegalus]